MNNTLNNDIDIKLDNLAKSKTRKPWLAALLSLLFPGLGQLYAGRWERALVVAGLDLAPALLTLIPGILGNFKLLSLLSIISIIQLLIRFYAAIEAYILAAKVPKYTTLKYHTALYLIGFAIISTTFKLIISEKHHQSYQAYRMGANGNIPTLEKDEYILVDYNSFMNSSIAYGDLVAFQFNGTVHIFRVIGLPNDSIEMQEHLVKINGKACNLTPIDTLEDRVIFTEELPNGHTHKIQKLFNFENHYAPYYSFRVSPDYYFLLGDNRNSAYDSRMIGTIAREDIIGKALYIYFSKDFNRIGEDLTKN